MSYKDKTLYDYDKKFSQQELLQVQPEDIETWFCFLAYGNPNPGHDDNPTVGRANTLLTYKKSISYYMPHTMIPWNIITKHGNPTKSLLVNARIKKVSKKEVNQQGKKSQARKPFVCAEFK